MLLAARELARQKKCSIGEALTDLARKGLQQGEPSPDAQADAGFLGFRPLPQRGVIVTNDLINRLREEGSE